MRISSRGLMTLAVMALVLSVIPVVPAAASETALRGLAHARVAAIVNNAVAAGLYSDDQVNYVTSALLPTYIRPRPLASKVQRRTVSDFWAIVSEYSRLPQSQVKMRLVDGAALVRIVGPSAPSVQQRIYRWLARPVSAAHLSGRISTTESKALRDGIARAVDRLMLQPGGPSGKVVISPRRTEAAAGGGPHRGPRDHRSR